MKPLSEKVFVGGGQDVVKIDDVKEAVEKEYKLLRLLALKKIDWDEFEVERNKIFGDFK